MICAIHHKEMRYNAKFGYSCPTPIEKSPDGKTVTKWCDFKPQENGTSPSYTPKMASTAEEIREKIAPEPNWDEIARGKVRNSVAVAFIGLNQNDEKYPICNDATKQLMEEWVDWIMSGK